MANNDESTYGLTAGNETVKRHYQSLIHKYEMLKEDHDSLLKRYSDLVGSHGHYVSKLELAHEENFRNRESVEKSVQERNLAIIEMNGLKQQCTQAIRNWDKSRREAIEYKEQLAKVQLQRDEVMKDINVTMTKLAKAAKDNARLSEERNAALQEYTQIMSEREDVLKENEKLQKEQEVMQKLNQQLETEKKQFSEEIESLKSEISSALFDRDRLLKVCNDLREKYNDYVTGINDDPISPIWPQSRSGHNFWGSSSSGVSNTWAHMVSKNSNLVLSAASSNSSVSTFSHNQHNKLCSNSRLDNIDLANSEIESLRKQVERLQTDLGEAQQEVEVCKRRRDWAFNERGKIVLERESIRTLCDKLRRERDRAVSDLAEALRESDDSKHEKNEAIKELKELKEKIEGMKLDRELMAKSQHNSQLGTNNSSRDSAIETDFQEYEIKTMDVLLKRELKSKEWGFTLQSADKSLVVSKVNKDSVADGKLAVSDVVMKINEMSVTNDMKIANDLLKKNDLQIHLTIQRKRMSRFVQSVTFNVENGLELGLELESGYYVSRINAGSLAAKEGNIAVGDRVISINDKPLDENSVFEVMQMLDSAPTILLQVIKSLAFTSKSQSNSSSSIVNTSKGSSESTDSKCSTHRERQQRKMVSCCSQTDNNPIVSQPNAKPSVPSIYKPMSRMNDDMTNSSVNNKSLKSSLTSSSAQAVKTSAPTAPTLLDKAYNKIYGERKQSAKTKQEKQQQMNNNNNNIINNNNNNNNNCFRDEEVKNLAELDKVLDKYDKYSNGKSSDKSSKYTKSSKSSKKDKNGGTWPKYRGHPPIPSLQNYGNVNAVMTLHPIKRKERKSLGFITNLFSKSSEKSSPVSTQSETTTITETNRSPNNSIKEEAMSSSSKPSSYLIFEPSPEAAIADYERNSKRRSTLSTRLQALPNQKTSIYSSNRLSFNDKINTLDLKVYHPLKALANSSLDYSVVSAQSKDKNVLDYYKHRTYVNPRQIRPHSVHDVLSNVTQPLTPNTLSMTTDHSSYDSFQTSSTVSSAPPPPPTSAPIPPIRSTSTSSYPYYALNNMSHPQLELHVHHNHYSVNPHLSRETNQSRTVQHSNHPQSLILGSISRSGDSLLSANDSQLNPHDLAHSRSVSAYEGGIGHYGMKGNLDNRYSITSSPSPSQYISGLFGGVSPSHSMDIITTMPSGAHFHNIETKRLVAPQHSHPSHIHHTSISNNKNVYRSDENNVGIPSFDGLSTFPKRSQRFRISSNPSVTCKSSAGRLSTSSIDKTSSTVLSDRESPMPCTYHVEWLTPTSGSSHGGHHRVAAPGDQRNISIDLSSGTPMGIQISECPGVTGGVFVCNVTENSLADQAGILVGDQLLEICGINMRNATFNLAANVLRQCGNNILMRVQYNPDKFRDIEDNDNVSDDNVDADDDDDNQE
ncbi:disks large homolog 5-like [Oppia nitens]|uniref:disks large homolog 5-like n=1 Tax=Oppia nitens TaxID=1686743 RepID=UPI0023DB7062|nr:disks large homolog 5-like [Oppia nitens]